MTTRYPEPVEIVRQIDRVRSARGGVVRRVTLRLDEGRLVSYFEASIPGGHTVACDTRAAAFDVLRNG